MKIEWVIVKGVSQFANDLDPPNNLWKSFACTMAASLVFNMLNDPLIFKNWPHFDGKCSSAWMTALRCINPVYQQGFESSDIFVQNGGPHYCDLSWSRDVWGLSNAPKAILNEGFSVLT